MKKRLFILTVAILMFSAVACQNAPLEEQPKETQTEVPAGTTITDIVTEEASETETFVETEIMTEAVTDHDSVYDPLRPDYDLGTCRALEGEVSVVLFYMDDFESSWTKAEMSSFTQKEINPALTFLEKEAASYGVELNLTVKESFEGVFYDDEVITSVKLTGLATIDVLEQAARALDYKSAEAMIQALKEQYQTDEVVCLTLFNKNGTAYAINPPRGEALKVEEHCIVFARDLYSSGKDPTGWQISVVAHELLHLFGAEDFYASATRKALAKSIYPKDLMLSAQYNIKDNNIGEATAYYIGWRDTAPEILYDEGW